MPARAGQRPLARGRFVCFAAGLAALTVLAGCANFELPIHGENRFRSNDNAIQVSADEMQRLRQAWDAHSESVIAASTVPARHLRWVRDFIALSHAQGLRPCRTLRLESILTLPMLPFRAQSPDRRSQTDMRPTKYYESWLVSGCGQRIFWRVFEDEKATYDTPTVVTWRVMP